jgi:hypothetical protein
VEDLWLIGLDTNNAIIYSKLGNFNSSQAGYWSTERGAMSMDGTLVIMTQTLAQMEKLFVYAVPTGFQPVTMPVSSSTHPAPASRPVDLRLRMAEHPRRRFSSPPRVITRRIKDV